MKASAFKQSEHLYTSSSAEKQSKRILIYFTFKNADKKAAINFKTFAGSGLQNHRNLILTENCVLLLAHVKVCVREG